MEREGPTVERRTFGRGQTAEEFWTAFRDRIEEASTQLSPRKPQPRHYYSIGVGGYHISFYVNEDESELGLGLTIVDNAEAFRELQNQADEIRAEGETDIYCGGLRETRAGNTRSELGVNRAANIENRDEWNDYFEWMLEMERRFHEVFLQRVRNPE